MEKITTESLKKAYKPFDIISLPTGEVGYIKEVNLNSSQDIFEHQISYSVTWLTGNETMSAWWKHDQLVYHCNLFMKIAADACHPLGSNANNVELLFKHI